ncbi:MAG: chemotaxis protein CheX [Syntrophales bacterium]|nr:chemotaxis protein CheX [Syntrophales bacterium]
MDVRFINPFIKGTTNVIKTMAFIEPIAGKPYLKKDQLSKGDVSGVIGLTGDARGSLALSFTASCIFAILQNMLGEKYTEVDDEVLDAVGELTNMISGDARKHLEAEGLILTAAIPTIISGKDHVIKHIISGPSIIIPFSTANGSFVLDVCLE